MLHAEVSEQLSAGRHVGRAWCVSSYGPGLACCEQQEQGLLPGPEVLGDC